MRRSRALSSAALITFTIGAYIMWPFIGAKSGSEASNSTAAPQLAAGTGATSANPRLTNSATTSAPQPDVIDSPSPGAPEKPPAPAAADRLALPSVATLRGEVQANPHQLAFSYVAFSLQAAERLVDALDNPSEANGMFDDLEQILAGTTRPSQDIEAVCLTHARLLAQAHPALATRYDALYRQAGSFARQMQQDE